VAHFTLKSRPPFGFCL
jgi:hypothetical protein